MAMIMWVTVLTQLAVIWLWLSGFRDPHNTSSDFSLTIIGPLPILTYPSSTFHKKSLFLKKKLYYLTPSNRYIDLKTEHKGLQQQIKELQWFKKDSEVVLN